MEENSVKGVAESEEASQKEESVQVDQPKEEPKQEEPVSEQSTKTDKKEDAPKEEPKPEPKKEHKPKKEKRPRKPLKQTLDHIYTNHYKKLLIIPFLMLVLAFAQMGYQASTTGDFIHKGISLKGGISVTFEIDSDFDIASIEADLKSAFPENDINLRTLSGVGAVHGFIVEADFDLDDSSSLESLISAVGSSIGEDITREKYSVEGIGSSLGSSFFIEAAIAMLVAFLFMGLVVFFYFKNLAPSIAVILAAFSDIVVTISIINMIGIKMSTSGIVALLLLIGYSVDTDIVLSTKVLKRKEGTLMHRIYGAMKTGLTMTSTTIVAVSIALIVTQSIVIKQIMLILLIGLLVDLINTWIQNVGLIRLFVEGKKHKHHKE